jgi:hypothetical protein
MISDLAPFSIGRSSPWPEMVVRVLSGEIRAGSASARPTLAAASIMSSRHNFVTAIYHATAAPVCRKIVVSLLSGTGRRRDRSYRVGLARRGSRGQSLGRGQIFPAVYLCPIGIPPPLGSNGAWRRHVTLHRRHRMVEGVDSSGRIAKRCHQFCISSVHRTTLRPKERQGGGKSPGLE